MADGGETPPEDSLILPSMVESRLEGTLDLQGQVLLSAACQSASDNARWEGSEAWTYQTAPPAVKRIVADCTARFMRNPDGYNQSRAGDEMVGWDRDVLSGVIEFTENEKERLHAYANPEGERGKTFGTFATVAWGHKPPRRVLYVESSYGPNTDPKWFPVLEEGND